MSSAVCAIVRVRWRSLLYHCVSVTRRTPFVCIACPQNIAPSEFHANGRLTLACVSSAVFIARGINAALEPVTPALLLKCRVPTSRTTLYQLLGFLLILPPPPSPVLTGGRVLFLAATQCWSFCMWFCPWFYRSDRQNDRMYFKLDTLVINVGKY